MGVQDRPFLERLDALGRKYFTPVSGRRSEKSELFDSDHSAAAYPRRRLVAMIFSRSCDASLISANQ